MVAQELREDFSIDRFNARQQEETRELDPPALLDAFRSTREEMIALVQGFQRRRTRKTWATPVPGRDDAPRDGQVGLRPQSDPLPRCSTGPERRPIIVMNVLRGLTGLAGPLFMGIAALTYMLGVGISRYLGDETNLELLGLGLVGVLLGQATMGLLEGVFRPTVDPLVQGETREERRALRNAALYASMAALAAVGFISYVVFTSGGLTGPSPHQSGSGSGRDPPVCDSADQDRRQGSRRIAAGGPDGARAHFRRISCCRQEVRIHLFTSAWDH